MDFDAESEIENLAKKFKDSVELTQIKAAETKDKKFTPFRTKYESPSNTEKLQTVEQELSKLKELQSQVLTMQTTIEDTIEKEMKRTKEKEIKELRHRYRAKIRELESEYKRKEEQIRRDYEEKLGRVVEKIKERAKAAIQQRVNEEIEKIKKIAEKKILEMRLRDKTVIDKLSQMYVDLKEKYRKDIQKIVDSESEKNLDRR